MSNFAVFIVLRTACTTPVAISITTVVVVVVVALLEREGGFEDITTSSVPTSILYLFFRYRTA
jgi:hypothetical protein